MAKKKKPQLKASAARGFATTSVPKRAGADEPVPDASSPEPAADAPPAVDTDLEPAATGSDADAVDAAWQALQALADAVYPRVEKEVQKRMKVRAPWEHF